MAMKDRTRAPTSWSRSPDTIAAAIAHTIEPNSTIRIAHCQNDHSLAAAVHRRLDESNRMFSATANIIPVADSAIPRPAFSNVTHTTSPTLHVDLNRRRVTVYENAVLVGSELHVGSPKSHASRAVRYPEFLDAAIRAASLGKHHEELLFGDGVHHLRLPNSRDGWFAKAVARARAQDPTFRRVTPHDLRHTAASLAISAGANVKAVQRMLGHASAAMTLDTYADLFDDDLDAVAFALGRARQQSLTVVHETGPVTSPVTGAQLPGWSR